jgi:hypothetical protein
MLPELKQVLTQSLEESGVHKMALEGTLPETAIKNIFTASGHTAGVWECGPGKYHLARKTDEFCVLLAGHWKLEGVEGDNYELKAGDTILLKKGWEGTSHILERIRKVYITWE